MSTSLGAVRRGDARQVKLWATDPATGLRLTLTDKKVWFTAKYRTADLDTAAVIRKGTGNTGTTGQNAGITVATVAGPATTAEPWLGGDVATVAIAAADTEAVPDTGALLVWDAQFAPAAGGEPQTPEEWTGTLLVRPDVTRAA